MYRGELIAAYGVVRSLNQIIGWRGHPQAIRVDNGPKYLSGKLMEWAYNNERLNMSIGGITPPMKLKTAA